MPYMMSIGASLKVAGVLKERRVSPCIRLSRRNGQLFVGHAKHLPEEPGLATLACSSSNRLAHSII